MATAKIVYTKFNFENLKSLKMFGLKNLVLYGDSKVATESAG